MATSKEYHLLQGSDVSTYQTEAAMQLSWLALSAVFLWQIEVCFCFCFCFPLRHFRVSTKKSQLK